MRATSLSRTMEPSGFGAEHDVAELLLGLEAALGAHGVGELLPRRHRLAADLAGGVHGVLRLDGVDDLRDGDAQLGQLVRAAPRGAWRIGRRRRP